MIKETILAHRLSLTPFFLHDQPQILPWKKFISNEWSHHNYLVIVTSSAIDCGIISRTKTERVRHGDDVQRLSFLSSCMDWLCRVRNIIMYVLLCQIVSAFTWVWFWCLFPLLLRNSGNKHQNNPLMSAETVRHSCTYIILNVYILVMMSQSIVQCIMGSGNIYKGTWYLTWQISILFSDMYCWSCMKSTYHIAITGTITPYIFNLPTVKPLI